MIKNRIAKNFFIIWLLLISMIVYIPEVSAPSNSSYSLGYEFLQDDSILRIWNLYDNYYFNVSNGIQFTNHYMEYWSTNVMMLGYYDGEEWNLVYRVDELSGFNKNIELTESYCNATIWKELSYLGYDFRIAIRYCLGVNDRNLTVIPYIKNLGTPIPYDLAFGWELKDIKINNLQDNNFLEVNTSEEMLQFNLSQNLNETFSFVNNSIYYLYRGGYYLYLDWNSSLDYLLTVKSRAAQYNAPVTLFIKIGTLDSAQEKYTSIYWYDSSLTIRPMTPDIVKEIGYQYPSSPTTHYDKVDDVTPDDASTYVFTSGGGADKTDIFTCEDHTTEYGAINSVTVYNRVRCSSSTLYGFCAIRIGSTNYYGTQYSTSTSWSTKSYTWTVNPADSQPFEWTDIDAMGIGAKIDDNPSYENYLTQVYAVVDYTATVLSIYTNASTGVEETNATLNGWIQDDNGSAVSAFFQYGLTTSYGSSTSKQFPKNTNDEFEANIGSLSPGTLYHYRAAINDSVGEYDYGADMTFTTKPNPPTSLSTDPSTTSIALSWTKGSGATKTYIERSESSSWNLGEGTFVYNNTGSSTTDSGLDICKHYYYQAWSFTDQNYSDTYAAANDYTLPNPPSNLVGTKWGSYLNFTWTAGTGADTTLVRKKSGSYPSSVTDGTLCQNNSLTYYNESYGSSLYYSLWSWNNTVNLHSEKVDFAYGGLIVNVYDEDTSTELTFDIIVSDLEGEDTYSEEDCTNPLVIDVSLCPQGNIMIYIEAENYSGRIYYMEIYSGYWYELNAYLSPASTGEAGGECSLRPYTDSKTVVTYLVDLTIYLTYSLQDMISVEIYNTTLYGTYGGWLFITNDKFSFSSSQVIINKSVLDENTSMARVNYYYLYCPGDIESAVYYLRVVETIQTDYSTYDKAVENAFVQIKKMLNGTWSLISSLYSDANGYVNLYLQPEIPLKVYISKSGYNSAISDYLPPPPNQHGQTTEKWFRLIKNYTEPPIDEWETLWTNITWSIEPKVYYFNTDFIIYYNISSIDNKLEWYDAYLYFYDSENITWILLDFDNESSSSGGSLNFTVPNITGKYSLVARFKKENYSIYTFGAADGCRFYFIFWEVLAEIASSIPDLIYLFIMIFIMIAAIAFLVKFGAGVFSGVGGIGVMAFMLALKPDLTLGSPAVSAWWMFAATVIVYLFVVFISRGKT